MKRRSQIRHGRRIVRVVKGLAVLAGAVMIAVTASGCGFDPSTIPVPGSVVSGPTYRIQIEFANALNVPARAKVMANGTLVGTLHSLTLVPPSATVAGHVQAEVDIKGSVVLPATTTAQLRQNTLLGDIFIGLNTPPDGYSHTIEAGDTIPMSQTEPAMQVEDLLAGLSTFVTGGALHQLDDIINRTNAVMLPDPRDTARIFNVLGTDATDVAEHLDTVDHFLDAIDADIGAATNNRTELGQLLTDAGSTQLTNNVSSLVLTIGIFGGFGGIAHSVAWLAPFFTQANAAATALVPMLFAAEPLDLSAPSNLNRLVALIRTKIMPFVAHPTVNIEPIVSKDDQVARDIATLQMIGAVR